MSDFNKFRVDFFWETEEEVEIFDSLIEDDDFDEDSYMKAHTWTRTLDICYDEDEFDAFHQSDIFDKIEKEYGILDCSGDANELGFDSYEISPENMPIVWDKLVEALKSFIKNKH